MRSVTLLALAVAAGTAAGQPGREPPLAGTPFRVTRVEPAPIHLPPVVSPSLKILTQPAVHTELSLTPRQKAIVEALNGGWEVSPKTWEVGTFGLVTPEMGRAAVMQHTKNFLENGLSKDQRSRLDQIVFQLREREFGAYAAFAMAARDLGLRDEQLEDVANLKGERVLEIAKHVTSGERFEKVKERVTATNGETFEKMAEMLTKTQRERLKEMRGSPFAGQVNFGQVTRDAPTWIYPSELFGLYDFELRYLLSTRMRAELDLTADQREKLILSADVWDSEYQKRGLSVEKAGELHDLTAKALDEILTPRQRSRFHQLMARRRLDIGGLEAASGYPAVVAALKIVPNQLQALKNRRTAADVLTKTEMTSLEAFFGQPLKDPDDVSDPIMARLVRLKQAEQTARKAAGSFAAVARSFLVISDRLKLSDKQITRLRELAEDEAKIMELIQKELDFADTPPVVGSTRSLTSANVVASRFKESIEEQCFNVLDAQQQSTARRIFGVKR